ncbi:MAG: hypothetical protein AABY00_04170 [Nanoarchaeota archaeon]
MLYHASRVSGLKVLKPFSHPVVGNEKVVFATIDKLFALAMTYGSGDVLAACYAFNFLTGKREFYIDEIKKGSLQLLKKPASLYVVVDAVSFHNDSRLHSEELISTSEVKIFEEIRIANVFDYLLENGAQIIPYDKVLESMKKRGKDPGKPKQKHGPERFGVVKR